MLLKALFHIVSSAMFGGLFLYLLSERLYEIYGF